MKTAPVNKIIPFSNVDGPGNRTSIFFQGCPFNCLFCHNPETINLCVGCGDCVAGCPAGALSLGEGRALWDSKACVQCDACIRTCPHGASPKVRWMTVEEVLREVKRSAPYIDGVTTSGGECTLQNEFLIELFGEVKKLGKTCLIDSNGSFDFEKDPRVLAVCDGVMLDVKAVEPAWCRRLTGRGPEMPLKNLDYLLRAGKLQEARTVIFPGRDAENEETVRYTARRVGGACDYKIIRYRPYGVREAYRGMLGEYETEADYAEKYALMARELGASRAYVV
ncbi:MAG: YjjW family glycine radical enzyme activase [Clostridia bacterium]|nr:YjjW family glycine radical enzyme activase [Clostridia bacterium]